MELMQLPGMQFQVNTEWLDHISDEQGLTKGQKALLKRWSPSNELIPEQVAYFIKKCKGYRRNPSQDWQTTRI